MLQNTEQILATGTVGGREALFVNAPPILVGLQLLPLDHSLELEGHAGSGLSVDDTSSADA
jgi:hypothetical protein